MTPHQATSMSVELIMDNILRPHFEYDEHNPTQEEQELDEMMEGYLRERIDEAIEYIKQNFEKL